jgi:hypothetical protein
MPSGSVPIRSAPKRPSLLPKVLAPSLASPGLTPEQQKQMQQIRDDQKEVDETKKILTDKIQKLIDRGEKLEDLEAAAEDLEKQADMFKENTVEVKKAVEVTQSREHGLELGLLGIAIGIVYGFFAGYTWPIQLILGALNGSFLYGTTRVFTGINQKIDDITRLFSPFSPVQEKAPQKPLTSGIKSKLCPYKPYLPRYATKSNLKNVAKMATKSTATVKNVSRNILHR